MSDLLLSVYTFGIWDGVGRVVRPEYCSTFWPNLFLTGGPPQLKSCPTSFAFIHICLFDGLLFALIGLRVQSVLKSQLLGEVLELSQVRSLRKLQSAPLPVACVVDSVEKASNGGIPSTITTTSTTTTTAGVVHVSTAGAFSFVYMVVLGPLFL